MQRLARRSSGQSSSTEHSDTAISECQEEQIRDEETRPRKRPTVEAIHSDETTQSKRARQNSSQSKDAGEDVGDFIVVASSRPSLDPWSSRNQQHSRDGCLNSPMLYSSSLSSLESICSPFASYTAPSCAFDGSDPAGLPNGSDRNKWDDHDATTRATSLVQADCESSFRLPDLLCAESSNQTLSVDDRDDDSRLASESLRGKPVRTSSPEREPLADIGGSDAPIEIPTKTAWVSVNTPSAQKPSSSHSDCYQSSRTTGQDSPVLQNAPLISKRTPLPSDKVDSQSNVSKVLSSIPRDPRYALARPHQRTFSNEETNLTADVVQVKESGVDIVSMTRTTSPVHASALSLHNLYSLVSGLDKKGQQLYASRESSIPANSEPLIATTSASPIVTTISTSVENGTVYVPSQGLQAFSTFPSKFQVSTTESIGQNQLSGQKRRYRRKNTSEQTHLVVSSPVSARDIERQDLGSTYSIDPKTLTAKEVLQQSHVQAQEQAQPRTPSIPSTKIESNISRSPFAYTTEPQVLPPSRNFCPPAVEFTIDNRAESILPASEVTSLFADLSKNASVLLVPSALHSSNTYPSQPIGILMWQTLSGFYSWYSAFTGVNVTWCLKFELLDVHWQPQKSFILPHGNLDYFRALKQYIWDLYWIATSVNHGVSPFRVSIGAHPIDVDHSSAQIPERNPETLQAVSNHQQHSQTIPSIQLRHELRDDPRTHALTDSHARLAPSQRHNPFDAESKAIASPITGHSNSKLVVSPTVASPAAISHSTYPTPLQSTAINKSWHSHRMPHKGSGDAETTTESSIQQLQCSRPAHQHSSEYVRTESDKMALRMNASRLIPHDMELFAEESSVYDKFPYKTGAQVLGAIIDKMGGIGTVSITGKGYITLNVATGVEEVEDRYQRVNINAKQTCMLHKGAIVLYYKRRVSQRPPSTNAAIGSSRGMVSSTEVYSPNTETLKGFQASNSAFPVTNSSQPTSFKGGTESAPTSSRSDEVNISLRLQVERSGMFSAPFDKSFLRPSISVTEFFSWFSQFSGCEKPDQLKFTFKDAMPAPTSTQILRGNEDHFRLMRMDIKVQCAKAKAFMPDLKDFVILITVPGWDMPQEDW